MLTQNELLAELAATADQITDRLAEVRVLLNLLTADEPKAAASE